MITTFSTSSQCMIATFGYKQKFPQKHADTELCDGIRLKWTYDPFCDYFVNYSFSFYGSWVCNG
jgi:hypothetical protein